MRVFDPRSIPLQRWDDYALANNLPGRRGVHVEKTYEGYDENYEMDDMKSMYSSVKPASTILTGFPVQSRGAGPYMTPQSPAFGGPRQSTYTIPYADSPIGRHQSVMSLGGGLDPRSGSPYQDYPNSHRPSMIMLPHHNSSGDLLSMGAPSPSPLHQSFPPQNHLFASQSQIGFTGGARSPLDPGLSRPVSQFDFQREKSGPDDSQIVDAIQVCLREVDLDTVTKKQVRALVEQRLQTECVGERRTFLDRMIDSELANM